MQPTNDQRDILSPSKRTFEFNIVQSNYGLKITPRCVIVGLYTNFCYTYTLVKLGTTTGLSFKNYSGKLLKRNR